MSLLTLQKKEVKTNLLYNGSQSNLLDKRLKVCSLFTVKLMLLLCSQTPAICHPFSRTMTTWAVPEILKLFIMPADVTVQQHVMVKLRKGYMIGKLNILKF